MSTTKPWQLLLLSALYLLTTSINATTSPPPGTCSAQFKEEDDDSSPLIPIRKEVYGNGRIFDISHRYTENLPSWGTTQGLGQFLWLPASMKNGSLANNSEMKMPTHTGPGLLVDVPRDKNITAEVMKSLNIPKGVRRVLFRSLNTDRGLMWKKEFDTSYVGFMKDGAKWLVDNTDIKLVGVDYLSAAAYDDLIPSHHEFLRGREVILVEGLKLDDIVPGIYSVHCLPLRLLGAEGSPIRCILIK
ncbi:Cyclase-like protein 2 [Ranunculus cassubicifolius]